MFIRFCIISLFFLGPSLFANEEEALHVRRIVAFWQDGDHDLAETEVQKFLKRNPNSSFRDSLEQMLGDIYFERGEYESALRAFEAVENSELQGQSLVRRIQCLQRLGRALSLDQELSRELQRDDLDKSTREQLKYYQAVAHMERGELEVAEELFQHLGDELLYHKEVALGHIYKEKESYEKAYKHYLTASRLDEKNREDLLLLAAKMQMYFDPDAGLDTLKTLQTMSGRRGEDALFQELALLHEMGRYHHIVAGRERFTQGLSDEKMPAMHFYLGRAFYFLERSHDAAKELESFLKIAEEGTDSHKTALLTLLLAYKHSRAFPEVDRVAATFERLYPSDPSLAKALFIRASALAELGRYEESNTLLTRVKQDFQAFADQDAVAYEEAMLHFRQEDYARAREKLLAFVNKYSSSRYVRQALKNIPVASMRALEKEETVSLKELLVEDLKLALERVSDLTEEEAERYRLKIAKTQFDLQRFDEVIELLENELEDGTSYPYQTHFLLAAAYFEGPQNLYKYAKHTELALKERETHPKAKELHLNLFQAYHRLAKEVADGGEDYLEKAAEHLIEAKSLGGLDRPHLLWLARFGAERVEKDTRVHGLEGALAGIAEQSALSYKEVFQIGEGELLSKDELGLEEDLFKFCTLLKHLKQQKLLMQVLSLWTELQEKHKDWSWTKRGEPATLLADLMQETGHRRKAKDLLEKVESNSHITDAKVLGAARLRLARLNYQELTPVGRQDRSRELNPIIKALEDLRLRKQLASEPIHLEAAIDLAHILAKTSTNEEQELLKQLLIVKEEFTSRQDLWSKDYHATRKSLEAQDLVYQAYMMLIDAQISYLQSFEGGTPDPYKRDAARTIFSTLLEGKFAVSDYLVQSARSGLKAMDKNQALSLRWIESPAGI